MLFQLNSSPSSIPAKVCMLLSTRAPPCGPGTGHGECGFSQGYLLRDWIHVPESVYNAGYVLRSLLLLLSR